MEAGAPEDILVDAKPHIGTDLLVGVVRNLRRAIEEAGGEVRFLTRLDGLVLEGGAADRPGVADAVDEVGGEDGEARVTAVRLVDERTGAAEVFATDCVVLACGHSARDTFQMVCEAGADMARKPFAVGVRIEHPQALVNEAQYGPAAGHAALGAADYKLAVKTDDGRGVYSFCMCPGGEVVAAASEAERVVTNGMSEFARDKENINGGLLVNVTPEDYGGAEDPLAGIAFQRKLESAAYALGGGDYRAPAQRVGDFLAGRPSVGPGRVHPSYRPGVTWTDLRRCLPPFVADTIAGALPLLGQKLRGYDDPDAVLTAVESRSSSPVRIPRDGTCQSSLRGLYPCGEGAGYAGGILSAAADGMHCAEQLCQSIQKESDCL